MAFLGLRIFDKLIFLLDDRESRLVFDGFADDFADDFDFAMVQFPLYYDARNG